jgi:hypothetical protein
MLLLASLCTSAQSRSQQQGSPRIELKSGAISGRVVTESGQPLGNVNVYVRPATTEGLPVTNTTTNRDGVFKVTGLDAGSYTVTASVPAYILKSSDSGPVVYKVGDSLTLVFIKGGVVTGTVTNPKGDPLVGVGVRVQLVGDESGRDVDPRKIYENVTDDRGVYRVYGLPAGTYVVSADGSAAQPPGPRINPFANDMPTYAPSSSREAADEISVRAGEETSGVNIRYRGERGSTISGTVAGFRNEQGSWVTLTSTREGGPRWSTYFSAPSGDFAFEGIPDGDYHLNADTYGDGRERGRSESMVLNVRGADVEGIVLTAAPFSVINGRVILEALKTPPPQCTEKIPRLSDMSVSAWHRVTQGTGKKPQFVWRSGGAVPNAQGNITLQRLPPSEYYFWLRFSGEQWYLQSIAFAPSNSKPTDASRTWTIVKPGDQLSGLTFTVAQGASLVRGKIPLAEGETVPGKLSAYLVPADAEKAEDPLRYFAAPVNKEGYFWLHYVAPGRYWIVTQPGTDETRNDLSKLRLPDGAELRSLIRHAAAERKTEIELKPCQDVQFILQP